MGAMGSKERMDYTVLGDHVNLAARLCSYAAAKQTIVSDAVEAKIRDNPAFRLEGLEPIKVKGKSAALNVYSVTWSNAPGKAAPAVAETAATGAT
jgi:adenylate cyclase